MSILFLLICWLFKRPADAGFTAIMAMVDVLILLIVGVATFELF